MVWGCFPRKLCLFASNSWMSCSQKKMDYMLMTHTPKTHFWCQMCKNLSRVFFLLLLLLLISVILSQMWGNSRICTSEFCFCFLLYYIILYILYYIIYILCRLKGIIIFKLISNLLAQPSGSVMRSCYIWCAVLRGLWKQSPLLVKLWQGF